jgi:hypothetical protein
MASTVFEKSSQRTDSFRSLRDEKNRRFVSCFDKEIK